VGQLNSYTIPNWSI